MDVQIIGPSLDEIKAALDVAGDLRAGSAIPLPEGATLNVEDVSKASGFDATTVILTAVITVATSTSTALLIEWLKSKLFKSGGAKPATITIVIDGKEISVRPDGR
jgi:hypothetical protein